ncbi:MAG: undecaprenyl-diphosphate phosphatase [Cypionkella sp.]|nr:undecaprenyl-diphosphate phosphatase [Cypionkella sp.]
MDLLLAALLGILEGLTEFIPVSSTGHLLLAGHFLGFDSTGKTFEVVIQLGAVFALVFVYFAKLAWVLGNLHRDPAALRFAVSVLLAFLPAAVIGVLAHDIIKTVLFESPVLIAVMLILGGIVLLFVDRIAPPPRHEDASALPFRMALSIGFIQCLAMVPGVSRSGATIVGARMLGASRVAAAEFSFFLSLPTMAGAVAYDLFKNRDVLDFTDLGQIGVGFAAAFIVAILVVRWVLAFLARNGFALFGWWRIMLGVLVLAILGGVGQG